MKEKLHGILLGKIRHNDRHNVITVFTRERGRMSFLSPAGATKRSRQTTSRLQLLSVFETDVSIVEGRDLLFPSSYAPERIWRSIWYDPIKSVLIMFLSEFLSRLLRDSPPDPTLWDYIVDSTDILDRATNTTEIANFHIAFLVRLMTLTGIRPDLSGYSEGMEFDMESGTMTTPWSGKSRGAKRIRTGEAAMLPVLSKINFRNARCFRFSGSQRNRLLDGILTYYSVHFPGCDNLKSLEVIREIFK